MPLIKYTQYITYPNGNPASDREQTVLLLGGNVPVPLFSDKAGTVPLANPVTTDGDGLAEFYAAPGSFITELAAQIFHFQVDAGELDAAWPGVFVHEQVSSASVWTVSHHIGAPPAVTVLVAGAVVEAEVAHLNSESLTITFGAPTSGTALLRR
jgi:hypothetical protein